MSLNKIIPDSYKVLNLAGRFKRKIESLRELCFDLFSKLGKDILFNYFLRKFQNSWIYSAVSKSINSRKTLDIF